MPGTAQMRHCAVQFGAKGRHSLGILAVLDAALHACE